MTREERLIQTEDRLKDFCETLYPSHEDEDVSPLFQVIEAYVDAKIAVGVRA